MYYLLSINGGSSGPIEKLLKQDIWFGTFKNLIKALFERNSIFSIA
jgi:hypothetical protein